MVDIDDLFDFLINKYEVDIGDDYYRNCFNESLKKAFDIYISTTVPDIKVGQTVWVIRKDYNYDKQKMEYEILKCKVHKKTIKSKYTFSVRGEYDYGGTFTKNSIGKTVFFTEEEALKALEEKDEIKRKYEESFRDGKTVD